MQERLLSSKRQKVLPCNSVGTPYKHCTAWRGCVQKRTVLYNCPQRNRGGLEGESQGQGWTLLECRLVLILRTPHFYFDTQLYWHALQNPPWESVTVSSPELTTVSSPELTQTLLGHSLPCCYYFLTMSVLQEPYDFMHWWDIKQKATNEQDKHS